jgi:hypothetical protein
MVAYVFQILKKFAMANRGNDGCSSDGRINKELGQGWRDTV